MPDSPDASSDSLRIDFVTVVFRRELPLLTLQARSLARHANSEWIGEILLLVNDPEPGTCRDAIERRRAEYGPLAPKVRIVMPEEIAMGARRWYEAPSVIWMRHWRPTLRKIRSALGIAQKRRPVGWRGNNGWAMQQALKLLSAHTGTGSHVVFLDAKNHLLRVASPADFVAADGRARTRSVAADVKLAAWITASFERLGFNPPALDRVPPSVTPMVLERHVFQRAVHDITERLGPPEVLFALHRRSCTEFMLLYAAVDRGLGLWWNTLAPGLGESCTVFQHESEETALARLETMRRDTPLMAGVHWLQLERAGPALRERIAATWIELGLVCGRNDLHALFTECPNVEWTTE